MDLGKNITRTFSILVERWKIVVGVSALCIGTIMLLGTIVQWATSSLLGKEILALLLGETTAEPAWILYKILGLVVLISLVELPVSIFFTAILILTLFELTERKKYRFTEVLKSVKEVYVQFLVLSLLWSAFYFLILFASVHLLMTGKLLILLPFLMLGLLIFGLLFFFLIYPIQLFSTIEAVCGKAGVISALKQAWMLMKKDYLMVLLVIIVGPVIFVFPAVLLTVLLSLAFPNPILITIFSLIIQILATPAFSLFMILCWKDLRVS